MHLLPDVYESKIKHRNHYALTIQIILEFFSKGAEHGHTHGHVNMSHIPWLLFISLCIHAFLEGFPVSHHQDLAVGIAIHHLP
jgi:hypothetical protein